jgi:hypothetical protein
MSSPANETKAKIVETKEMVLDQLDYLATRIKSTGLPLTHDVADFKEPAMREMKGLADYVSFTANHLTRNVADSTDPVMNAMKGPADHVKFTLASLPRDATDPESASASPVASPKPKEVLTKTNSDVQAHAENEKKRLCLEYLRLLQQTGTSDPSLNSVLGQNAQHVVVALSRRINNLKKKYPAGVSSPPSTWTSVLDDAKTGIDEKKDVNHLSKRGHASIEDYLQWVYLTATLAPGEARIDGDGETIRRPMGSAPSKDYTHIKSGMYQISCFKVFGPNVYCDHMVIVSDGPTSLGVSHDKAKEYIIEQKKVGDLVSAQPLPLHEVRKKYVEQAFRCIPRAVEITADFVSIDALKDACRKFPVYILEGNWNRTDLLDLLWLHQNENVVSIEPFTVVDDVTTGMYVSYSNSSEIPTETERITRWDAIKSSLCSMGAGECSFALTTFSLVGMWFLGPWCFIPCLFSGPACGYYWWKEKKNRPGKVAMIAFITAATGAVVSLVFWVRRRNKITKESAVKEKISAQKYIALGGLMYALWIVWVGSTMFRVFRGIGDFVRGVDSVMRLLQMFGLVGVPVNLHPADPIIRYHNYKQMGVTDELAFASVNTRDVDKKTCETMHNFYRQAAKSRLNAWLRCAMTVMIVGVIFVILSIVITDWYADSKDEAEDDDDFEEEASKKQKSKYGKNRFRAGRHKQNFKWYEDQEIVNGRRGADIVNEIMAAKLQLGSDGHALMLIDDCLGQYNRSEHFDTRAERFLEQYGFDAFMDLGERRAKAYDDWEFVEGLIDDAGVGVRAYGRQGARKQFTNESGMVDVPEPKQTIHDGLVAAVGAVSAGVNCVKRTNGKNQLDMKVLSLEDKTVDRIHQIYDDVWRETETEGKYGPDVGLREKRFRQMMISMAAAHQDGGVDEVAFKLRLVRPISAFTRRKIDELIFDIGRELKQLEEARVQKARERDAAEKPSAQVLKPKEVVLVHPVSSRTVDVSAKGTPVVTEDVKHGSRSAEVTPGKAMVQEAASHPQDDDVVHSCRHHIKKCPWLKKGNDVKFVDGKCNTACGGDECYHLGTCEPPVRNPKDAALRMTPEVASLHTRFHHTMNPCVVQGTTEAGQHVGNVCVVANHLETTAHEARHIAYVADFKTEWIFHDTLDVAVSKIPAAMTDEKGKKIPFPAKSMKEGSVQQPDKMCPATVFFWDGQECNTQVVQYTNSKPTASRHYCTTRKGDSGAPICVPGGKKWSMIGIHVGGLEKQGVNCWLPRVHYAEWAREVTQGN